jgi:hypothetical protein
MTGDPAIMRFRGIQIYTQLPSRLYEFKTVFSISGHAVLKTIEIDAIRV